MNVIEMLKRDIEKYGVQVMSKRTYISYSFLYLLEKGKTLDKIKHSTLDNLYKYYKLEKDDFYVENMKKWERPTDSILGSLFRKKRHEKKLTIENVAKIIKGNYRQIQRIELGDSLPSYYSYYISKFFEIYSFSDEEKQTVSWYIVIYRDIMNVYNNDVGKKSK